MASFTNNDVRNTGLDYNMLNESSLSLLLIEPEKERKKGGDDDDDDN